MNKKQYWLMLLLATVGGFSGGVLGSRVFSFQAACAQEESRPAKVVEAQEFRLVDDHGKTRARLTMRSGKPLAEIPDLTQWTISLIKEGKDKE
jgi:hypothetical protein